MRPSSRNYVFAGTAAGLLFSVFSGISAELSVSGTAPAVNGLDQANLVTPTGGQLIWSDRPVQGNTFVSGSEGGVLRAVTIQISEGANAPISDWKDYVIRVGKVITGDPNVFEEEVMESVRQETEEPNDQYFTFVLESPVTLSPDTLYGFQIGLTGSEENWPEGIPSVRSGGSTFDGGRRLAGEKPNAGLGTAASFGNDDVIFHLDIDAADPAPPSFRIIGIEYDDQADTVALTWQSLPDEVYTVKYSGDLTDWGAAVGQSITAEDDEIPGDGDHITVSFDLSVFDPQVAALGELYFRIEK